LKKGGEVTWRFGPGAAWWKASNENYRLYSPLKAAGETGLLVIAGTSGATNLPNQTVILRRQTIPSVSRTECPADEESLVSATAIRFLRMKGKRLTRNPETCFP
jgi:hypothetical protein